MNRTPYNIQWEGKYLIIVNNNRNKIDTLPPTSKSTELAITSYLACLVKKGVEQICFLLAQCAAESCLIPKSLGDVTGLPADI